MTDGRRRFQSNNDAAVGGSLPDVESLILLPLFTHEVENGLLGTDTEPASTSSRVFPHCTEPPAQPRLCKIAHNERKGNEILRLLGAGNFPVQSRNFPDQSRLGGTPIETP